MIDRCCLSFFDLLEFGKTQNANTFLRILVIEDLVFLYRLLEEMIL